MQSKSLGIRSELRNVSNLTNLLIYINSHISLLKKRASSACFKDPNWYNKIQFLINLANFIENKKLIGLGISVGNIHSNSAHAHFAFETDENNLDGVKDRAYSAKEALNGYTAKLYKKAWHLGAFKKEIDLSIVSYVYRNFDEYGKNPHYGKQPICNRFSEQHKKQFTESVSGWRWFRR